jgi:hypothetical protein
MESIGRWPEAWAERAWRAKSKSQTIAFPMKRFTEVPVWDGRSGSGHIHVHAEAGAGDSIAMVRYLPQIAQMGLNVTYESQTDLVELVRRSMLEIEVVPKALDFPGALGLKTPDYHIPIGHLQHAFRTTLETTWFGPNLRPDPELVERYGEKLAERYGENCLPRVGLCWSSGIRLDDSAWLAEYGRRKSMHFDKLRPILVKPMNFISLQIGPEREQLKDDVWLVADILPEKPTWDDTAALIECHDLVITVDTSIAHLAGAMGKPVWVMAQRDASSWHFMCWRPGAPWNERRPWYPSARIFRQHEFNRPHYRNDVIRDVKRALQEHIGIAA